MGDFNSTSPELYHQVNHNETPSHYERRLDSFPAVSEKTWKVIIDTENNVATILVSGETKKETNELNEDLKQSFIKKLKETTTNEDIKDAIEKQTLKVVEIPWKEKIAISLNWNNIDYIYSLNWTEYFDFKWRRDDMIRYSAYRWVIKRYYVENNENWTYYLSKWDKKLNSFSKEWLNEYLWIAEHINWLNEWLEEVWEMDWNKVIEEEKNKSN